MGKDEWIVKTKYDVTKPAEYLRWGEHGQPVQFFGKPYVWTIEAGRLKLCRPAELPQIDAHGLELAECSMTAHCFVSNRHTRLPGCVQHDTPETDGVCSSCLADAEHDGR